MTVSLATFETIDASNIFSSSALSTMPATNLLKRQPYDRMRSSGTAGWAKFDLGSAARVHGVWIGYTNATSSSTFRVRASSNFATMDASPQFDTGTLQHWPGNRDLTRWSRNHALVWFSSFIAMRYWRVDMDVVAGAAYYEAGRICLLVDPWIPSRGVDFGDQIQPFDASQRRRARSGSAHAFPGGRYRTGQFRLSGLPLVELQRTMGDIERTVQGTKPVLYLGSPDSFFLGIPTVGTGVLLSTDEDLMDRCLYGYFSEPPYAVNETLDFHRANFALEEVEYP